MEISQVIGQNLKRLRQERNLSLGQLAEAAGVSKVMLSQIEKGDSNPTVNTLFKIVTGLGVSYSALMDQLPADTDVIRAGEAPTHVSEDGGYRLSCYLPNAPERGFEIYVDELDPGCAHETDGHGEGTEEFTYVAAGTLEMTACGETHELHAGDAIRFDASQPHVYANAGAETVRMVTVNRYPRQ